MSKSGLRIHLTKLFPTIGMSTSILRTNENVDKEGNEQRDEKSRRNKTEGEQEEEKEKTDVYR